jgi:hypothetical protein
VEVRFVRLEPPEVCREIPTRWVREEFLRRSSLAVEEVPGLDRIIEEQVDRWLQGIGLAGPGWPPPELEEQKKLAGDFWERRRRGGAPAGGTATNRREQALVEEVRSLREQLGDLSGVRALLRACEAELSNLRDERDRLHEEAARRQEELERLQEKVSCFKETGLPEWVPAEFRELRGLLILVDEKYSLESLNELVVAGQELEPPVTLRQFVSHLFFALRKRGLSHYPDRDEFDLSYNDSALYDCLGFEVSPGSTVRVAVRSKGWALRNGRTLIPVRRARVQRA